MDAELSFKNVIYYKTTLEKSDAFARDYLKDLSYLKFFKTSILNEVLQIVEVSSRTTIMVDNEEAAIEFVGNKLQNRKGHYRVYLIDWDLKLTKTRRDFFRLHDITPLYKIEQHKVMEKIELYLFGKVNIFKLEAEDKFEIYHPVATKSFFTQLQLQNGEWRVILSSHEREDNIGKILGKDWENFMDDILLDANNITNMSIERLEGKPFFELIYPHIKNNQAYKLSIIHLNAGTDWEANLEKIKTFLEGI